MPIYCEEQPASSPTDFSASLLSDTSGTSLGHHRLTGHSRIVKILDFVPQKIHLSPISPGRTKTIYLNSRVNGFSLPMHYFEKKFLTPYLKRINLVPWGKNYIVILSLTIRSWFCSQLEVVFLDPVLMILVKFSGLWSIKLVNIFGFEFPYTQWI